MMKSSKAKPSRAKTAKATATNGTKTPATNGTHLVAQDSLINGIETAALVAEAAPKVAAPEVSVSEPCSPTPEQVRMRAYELYLERGAAPGGELHDWIRAERELSDARVRP